MASAAAVTTIVSYVAASKAGDVGVSENCDYILQRVNSLQLPGQAGYGATDSLIAAPDLYRSAWTIAGLPAQRREAAAGDLHKLRARFLRAVQNPTHIGNDLGISEMDTIETASIGLAASSPSSKERSVALSAIERHRQNGGYGSGENSKVDVVSTYLAVRAIVALHAEVPKPVASSLKSQTRRLPSASSYDALAHDVLPVAIALVLAAPGSAEAQSLRPQLSLWASLIRNETPNGFALASAADVSVMEKTLKVPSDTFPELATLSTPGGFALTAKGDSNPKATFFASKLGLITPKEYMKAARFGRGTVGWLPDIKTPSISESYAAVAANEMCGRKAPRLTRFVRTNLERIDTADVSLKDVSQLCYLATKSNIHFGTLRARLRGSLTKILDGSVTLQQAILLKSVATNCEVPLDATDTRVAARLDDKSIARFAQAFLASGDYWKAPDLPDSFIKRTSTGPQWADPISFSAMSWWAARSPARVKRALTRFSCGKLWCNSTAGKNGAASDPPTLTTTALALAVQGTADDQSAQIIATILGGN